jgi:hypothetical protein
MVLNMALHLIAKIGWRGGKKKLNGTAAWSRL